MLVTVSLTCCPNESLHLLKERLPRKVKLLSRDARSNTAKQLHGLGPLGPPPEGNTSCYQPIDGLTRSPVAMAPKTPAEPIVTYFALTRTCNIHLAMSAPPPLQRRHLLLCGVLGGASGRFVCVIAVIVNFKDIRSVRVCETSRLLAAYGLNAYRG